MHNSLRIFSAYAFSRLLERLLEQAVEDIPEREGNTQKNRLNSLLSIDITPVGQFVHAKKTVSSVNGPLCSKYCIAQAKRSDLSNSRRIRA